MVKKAAPDPGEVVKAFRKAAKGLTEQQFQGALFAIGRHKPAKRSGKPRSRKLPPRRQA
jgi:hypothetical protein